MPRDPSSTSEDAPSNEATHILIPDKVHNKLRSQLNQDRDLIGILIGETIDGSIRKADEFTIWPSNQTRPPQLQENEQYIGFATNDDIQALKNQIADYDWLPDHYAIIGLRNGQLHTEGTGSREEANNSVTIWTSISNRNNRPEPSDSQRVEESTGSIENATTGQTESNSVPDVEYLDLEREVRELQKVFADITAEDFTRLNNGHIGVEVSYRPTSSEVDEFEVFIEYLPQYPKLPPRMWVMEPNIDAESNMVHRFDRFGHAQAAYTDPHNWNESLTGEDAARVMKQWIKNYCEYLTDGEEGEGAEGYKERLQNEISSLIDR